MSKRIPNLVAVGFSLLLLLSLGSSFYLQYQLEQSLSVTKDIEFLLAKTRGSVREIKVLQLERSQKLALLMLSGQEQADSAELDGIRQIAGSIRALVLAASDASHDPDLRKNLAALMGYESALNGRVDELLDHWQRGEQQTAQQRYRESYLPALTESLELANTALSLSYAEVKRYGQNSVQAAQHTQWLARTIILVSTLIGLIAALVLGRMVFRIVRQSQRAAQENQDMIEYSLDVICVFDELGRFVRVTDACQRIWGYRPDELIGRSCMDLVVPEDVEKTIAASTAILAGTPTRNFQNRHRRKDGSVISLMWSARWLDAQRQTFCVARDMTESDRVAEALKQNEERTRLILATAQDAFIGMDAQGLVIDWNPKAEQIFGWSAAEALGQPMHDLIIPPAFRQRHLDGLKRYLLHGEGPVLNRRLELTALNRQGQELPVEFTISPIRLNDEVIFSAFLHDISERLAADRELHQAKELAEAANRAKSEFLANMSHEIRTPMNGVLGTLSLLLDTELTPSQRELSMLAHASGESLLAIINDILDFSKIEAGKLSIESIGFNLLLIVEEVAAMAAPKASEKGLDVIVSYPEGVARTLLGDPGRIRQILVNLVNNALKFTERGQVLIDVQQQGQANDRVRLLVSVEDSGIGIAATKLERLFEKFTQADSSTTRRYGGTGLGLAISKQLVELMGGKIGGSSEPGKGSVFWFELELPLQPDDAPLVQPELSLQTARVLIVDDNPINRRVLEEQLSGWRVRNQSAADAPQALQMLLQAKVTGDPFQIAILDYQMPDIDGVMLGQQIKANPGLRDTELLMLTSLGQHELGPQLLQKGFAAYLMKPVRQSELLTNLGRVWSQHLQQNRHQTASIQPVMLAPAAGSLRFDGVRVLLAEDNTTNQLVGAMMLRNLGCQVDIAEDGQQAVRKLLHQSYHLVFMDCEMPVMDGFEATLEIRNLGLNLPIVAVTAQAMQGDRERCLACGMNDYISKPVQAANLAAALTRWLPASVSTRVEPVAEAGKPVLVPTPILDPERIAELQQIAGVSTLAGLVGIFDSFIREAPQWLAGLEQAIAAQDLAAMRQYSHKLAGASATLGLSRIAAVADVLQQQARLGSIERAQEQWRLLEQHYQEFLAYLQAASS